VQLLAYERHRSVFVKVAARADLSGQRAQVICADCPIDDLALAYVRLGGV
jgi:hypothetical protein